MTNQLQNGFTALSDPTRRAVFERLSRRAKPVGALAKGLPVSRPAVSQHLKVLQAAKLVFCSDPPGVRGPDGEIASEVSAATLTDWMASGVVSGGMIPKAEACLSALRAGVRRVTISDGRTPHALLVELLTPAGVGTMVVP